MARGPLGLTDAQFWTAPHKTEDAVIDRLMDEGFAGCLLDGPNRVDLARRETLPMHGVWSVSYVDLRRLRFNHDAHLVVVRLESNQVFVARAFEVKQEVAKAPPDEDEPPVGTVLRGFHLEVRDRLPELPWRAGTLLITLIAHDKVSNRVRVALTRQGSLDGDPKVMAFIAARAKQAWPQPVYPRVTGQPLPSYAHDDATPPHEGGLGLSVARLYELSPSGQGEVVVRGSFRLPLLQRYIVRPDDPPPPPPPPPRSTPPGGAAEDPPPPPSDEEPEDPPSPGLSEAEERDLRLEAARAEEARGLGLVFQDPGDRRAQAIVPVTLLVVPVEQPMPFVVPLQVPVHAAVDPAATHIEGQFAVDLLDLTVATKLLGPCFVYAFSGEAMVGPLQTAIVRADQLRPRQGGRS